MNDEAPAPATRARWRMSPAGRSAVAVGFDAEADTGPETLACPATVPPHPTRPAATTHATVPMHTPVNRMRNPTPHHADHSSSGNRARPCQKQAPCGYRQPDARVSRRRGHPRYLPQRHALQSRYPHPDRSPQQPALQLLTPPPIGGDVRSIRYCVSLEIVVSCQPTARQLKASTSRSSERGFTLHTELQAGRLARDPGLSGARPPAERWAAGVSGFSPVYPGTRAVRRRGMRPRRYSLRCPGCSRGFPRR